MRSIPRLKPGRPDLRKYAEAFDVPEAAGEAPLSVTFLGVSTLLFDDGRSALLTDGFFTRPGPLSVLARRLRPDRGLVARCLERAAPSRIEAVVPVHTHFDHVLDSATVAQHTGAVLLGGASAANVARGHGLPEARIETVGPGQDRSAGPYGLTFVPSAHCPPDRYPGTVGAPVAREARASSYRCGETWSLLVRHRPSGRTALVQGSAGFVPYALDGRRCEVAYLGVGGLGLRPESYIRAYWHHTVRAVGARYVVLTHWDDFFRPLDRPLRALPYAGDDFDVTMRLLGQEADADGAALRLPRAWRREDPWARGGTPR
ncbi:MBL fold metallo-hydrolase [Streptomyces nitrosporeus]|uniref:MBL fold metallo-hydrolase n=1 Tax=Streptomyces nitrosporeus TaxID=28894 RepID=A0A5J6FIG3_9ACTN|nr:MBL fold metallo-hydrolase [Streptomyces nitrosporeus]QEU76122.1 MBL fold metallo-hydrolase [Streptomyces nitrosporeus]GGZ08063.1 MBL fold metallo-hydrolase [Streptomyces nitrosporeus]